MVCVVSSDFAVLEGGQAEGTTINHSSASAPVARQNTAEKSIFVPLSYLDPARHNAAGTSCH